MRALFGRIMILAAGLSVMAFLGTSAVASVAAAPAATVASTVNPDGAIYPPGS